MLPRGPFMTLVSPALWLRDATDVFDREKPRDDVASLHQAADHAQGRVDCIDQKPCRRSLAGHLIDATQGGILVNKDQKFDVAIRW